MSACRARNGTQYLELIETRKCGENRDRECRLTHAVQLMRCTGSTLPRCATALRISAGQCVETLNDVRFSNGYNKFKIQTSNAMWDRSGIPKGVFGFRA